jgi:hypothetical protein
MSIRITDDQMICEETGHTAHRGDAGWRVSWLPGRTLDRNQAITAMTLGEAAGRGAQPGDRIWPFAEAWAPSWACPAPPRRSAWPAATKPRHGTTQYAPDAARELE